MKQQVVTCGIYDHLSGILSGPEKPSERKTAFLIWNTGVGSRVGHFRGHFELAQVLASSGYTLLRFDLAGRGDSMPRSEKLAEQQRNSLDIQEAMDYLEQQYGFQNFVLLGVCSGAVDLHHVALIDYRVIGFVMVDTYIHETPWFKFHYYWQRLNPLRVARALKRRWKHFIANEQGPKEAFFGIYPSRDEIRAAWRDFMKRDLATMVIYTGGFNYIYSYERQFQDMLDGVELNQYFRFHLLDRSDHVFTALDQRQNFHKLLIEWVEDMLPRVESDLGSQSHLSLPKPLRANIKTEQEAAFLQLLARSKLFRGEELRAVQRCYHETHGTIVALQRQPMSEQETFVVKMGRDAAGNLAWFRPAPDQKGYWQMRVDSPTNSDDLGEIDRVGVGRDENGNPAHFVRLSNGAGWYRLVGDNQPASANKV